MACPGTLAMTTAVLFFLVSTAVVVAGDMTFGMKPISRKTLIGFELKVENRCGDKACRYEVDPNQFCADLYLTHYDLRCGKCGAIYCNDLGKFEVNVETDAGNVDNMDLDGNGLIDNLNKMDFNDGADSGSNDNADMEVDVLPPPLVENS